MLSVLCLAAGLASGISPLRLALLALVRFQPEAASVTVLGLCAPGWLARRGAPNREVVFFQGVAAELRAGAGLRGALAAASQRTPDLALDGVRRLAEIGRPIEEVAAVLSKALPVHGRLAAAAVGAAGRSGGSVAGLFDRLALISVEDEELAKETRTAAVQGKLSALIVGGLPLGYLTIRSTDADWWQSREGIGRLLVFAGTLLIVLGLAVLVWLVRRALRRADQPVAGLAQLLLIGLSAGYSLQLACREAIPHLEGPIAGDLKKLLRRTTVEGSAPALEQAEGPLRDLFIRLASAQLTGASVVGAISGYLDEVRRSERFATLERVRKLPVRLVIPVALLILPGFVASAVLPEVVLSLTDLLGPLVP